jgi:hypothetical protein
MRFTYLMAGVWLAVSLGCFWMVAGWLHNLTATPTGYNLSAIPGGIANMPLEAAISGAVFLGGLAFLCIAVNLLSRHDP